MLLRWSTEFKGILHQSKELDPSIRVLVKSRYAVYDYYNNSLTAGRSV